MNGNKNLQAAKPASARLQCQTSPPHRILVVDDDDDIRRINAEVLIDSGYEVDAVGDGSVAWDTLQHKSYDLLVTDQNMAKVSGVELLRKLHAARMALPVIMATGTFPKDEFTRCPWLQPSATLLKPYTVAELVGTVKEVLRATDGPRDRIDPMQNWQDSYQPMVCSHGDRLRPGSASTRPSSGTDSQGRD